MVWVDGHCHLDQLADWPTLTHQAQAAGIERWVIAGTEPKQWQQAAQLFSQDPRMLLAYGHHPWFLPASPPNLNVLRQQLNAGQVIAIGEIGLDFSARGLAAHTKSQQEAWFVAQLALAQELALPVIVHSVKAHHRISHFIKAYPSVTGMIHAFIGSYQQAKTFVKAGWLLGVGHRMKNSPKTSEAFAQLPLEYLLLETDAPYLGQPKDNPLLDLLNNAAYLAALKQLTLTQLADSQQHTFKHFFNPAE